MRVLIMGAGGVGGYLGHGSQGMDVGFVAREHICRNASSRTDLTRRQPLTLMDVHCDDNPRPGALLMSSCSA